MSIPDTYAGLIKAIMAKQDPKTPAFQNERECREYMAERYPGLEGNYNAVRTLADAGFAAQLEAGEAR